MSVRPTRLEVEGFTAFRERAVVDLSDADLVALTGPTGSGKSSLIDAMIFALYGTVPRLDRRAVAPVISLGRVEARVALDFTVDGRAYRAVRVVRRTKSGASTKEARLERGDEVLAGNEKELTAEVGRLLGLSFEHFTRCVVLPQGEFARLLHDEPRHRQDLLVTLLDLGLYERMAAIARDRAARSRQAAELAGGLAAKLGHATPDAHAEAASRAAALAALEHEVGAAAPRLRELADVVVVAAAEVADAAGRVDALGAVAVPEGVGDRAASVAEARAHVERGTTEEETAIAATEAADDRRRSLPARSELESAQRAHDERRRLLDQRARGHAALAERAAAARELGEAVVVAEAELAAATEALEGARWEHRADDLARTLRAGEPCPVCHQAVVELPPAIHADAVGEAEHRHRVAHEALRPATAKHQEAAREHQRTEDKLATISDALSDLEGAIADHADPEALAAGLREVAAAESALEAAGGTERAARRATVAARQALERLEADQGDDRRRFDEARDAVAKWGPPGAERTDLAADWAQLAAWAAHQLVGARAEVAEAERRRTDAEAERAGLGEELAERCRALGVAPGDDPAPAVARALSKAEHERDRLADEVAEAAEHRADAAAHTRAAEVASSLGHHLGATGFEKWVLDEALGLLVTGATAVLHELSAGAFSLALDDRANFAVIDHHNADERRTARTLSGGETFLASLALALALADQIATLAARGSARLESIFLDEGFGTLDADTLDTVASAIEELGARGRMVGLITHVAELAERVPVRFEVTRGPGTATVERVG